MQHPESLSSGSQHLKAIQHTYRAVILVEYAASWLKVKEVGRRLLEI
ncbi:hypothetical protein KC19_12G010000 [Ceratodon purpureus]|uniref:Uncharacterized protein n=1 Tax=Ceratodon purpureus TaxID=3225 RepID=A0A8T0G5Q5_CERPU|nr:hypothetical protein KC19_12G010000 [Ceratodon purpureus]